MEINRDQIMQQAMAMQSQLESIQNKLADTLYTGNNGGKDGVEVTVNGNGEVKEVKIADELMNPEDKEMLQDMIMLAVNDALKKADDDRNSKLGSMTAGLNIPGLGR